MGSAFAAVEQDLCWRYWLRVQVPEDTPAGRYREAVLLHADDPARPRLNIEVNALIKASVHISPDTVDFGELSLADQKRQPGKRELTQQTLIVRNREGDMQITGLVSDLDILRLEQTATGSCAGIPARR